MSVIVNWSLPTLFIQIPIKQGVRPGRDNHFSSRNLKKVAKTPQGLVYRSRCIIPLCVSAQVGGGQSTRAKQWR
ncbi:unnamed protein product, partial [Nesidiocoris tenuis]